MIRTDFGPWVYGPTLFLDGSVVWSVQHFDPEDNGADVAAFAEMWPDSIYFFA